MNTASTRWFFPEYEEAVTDQTRHVEFIPEANATVREVMQTAFELAHAQFPDLTQSFDHQAGWPASQDSWLVSPQTIQRLPDREGVFERSWQGLDFFGVTESGMAITTSNPSDLPWAAYVRAIQLDSARSSEAFVLQPITGLGGGVPLDSVGQILELLAAAATIYDAAHRTKKRWVSWRRRPDRGTREAAQSLVERGFGDANRVRGFVMQLRQWDHEKLATLLQLAPRQAADLLFGFGYDETPRGLWELSGSPAAIRREKELMERNASSRPNRS